MNLILPGGIYMKKFVFSRPSRVSLVRSVRESVVNVVAVFSVILSKTTHLH